MKTIIFIHGLFMNPKSWDQWLAFFTEKGYVCHAPAYPYHEGEPLALRSSIDPRLGQLTLADCVEYLLRYIDSLDLQEKPILIGHSMGGLIVQKLIEMGKGSMGVCIDSAPPRGIKSYKWSFLRANLPVVNPLMGNSVFAPSHAWFRYAFCHTMTHADARRAFDEYVVSESRNIPRSSDKDAGTIDFNKSHAPLLFIAGEKDHIIPSSLNKKNFAAYSTESGKTDFKVFPGRTHFICGQKDWEEVATFIASWLA